MSIVLTKINFFQDDKFNEIYFSRKTIISKNAFPKKAENFFVKISNRNIFFQKNFTKN